MTRARRVIIKKVTHLRLHPAVMVTACGIVYRIARKGKAAKEAKNLPRARNAGWIAVVTCMMCMAKELP